MLLVERELSSSVPESLRSCHPAHTTQPKDKQSSQSQWIWCIIIGENRLTSDGRALIGMRGNAAFSSCPHPLPRPHRIVNSHSDRRQRYFNCNRHYPSLWTPRSLRTTASNRGYSYAMQSRSRLGNGTLIRHGEHRPILSWRMSI